VKVLEESPYDPESPDTRSMYNIIYRTTSSS
jgi:hypothetical protein